MKTNPIYMNVAQACNIGLSINFLTPGVCLVGSHLTGDDRCILLRTGYTSPTSCTFHA